MLVNNLTLITQIAQIITPIFIVILAVLLGIIFEKRILKRLNQLSENTGWQGYKIIIKSLGGVSFFWFLIVGFSLALNTIAFKPSVQDFIQKALLATFLGTVTFVVSRLAVSFIELYSTKETGVSPLTTLFNSLTRLLIFSLGLLIILQSVGIAITPLLTALGVGGISIGLALQNTLANLFSGLNILTSNKVRVGDYIRLKTGEEGYVTDILWRYTVIKEINENLMIIPNSFLLSSSFKNYGLPEKEMLINVQVGVSYDSDLEKVEEVTLDVARQIMQEVTGGVSEYQPFMRYTRFDYYSINFIVYLKVQEYFDQLVVKHEFIKVLHKKYQQEGIKLAFPIQGYYWPQQNNLDEQKVFNNELN
jgi:small-conductance mechanosensitive channel